MAAGGETPQGGIGHFLSNLVLRGLIGVGALLPYAQRIRLAGRVTATVLAPLAGWRNRIRHNLAHVMPDLPEAEVRRLLRAVPDNTGRVLAEMYSGREFAERVRHITLSGSGVAAFADARRQRRPVVFVTGHFGNYCAPFAWLAANGDPAALLYNPMRNAYFNAHYARAFSTLGGQAFPRNRRGLADLVRVLRAGGIVGLAIDQFMSHGKLLDFLGQPAPTALSAAELALKFDAALIPIYGIRQPDGLSFAIRVETPIPPGSPEAMTQALNDSLAAQVRQHPDQWFWVHRRWKPERHRRILARQGRRQDPGAKPDRVKDY